MNHDRTDVRHYASAWLVPLGVGTVLYLTEIVWLYVYAHARVADFWPRFYAWWGELEGALIGSGVYFAGLSLVCVAIAAFLSGRPSLFRRLLVVPGLAALAYGAVIIFVSFYVFAGEASQ